MIEEKEPELPVMQLHHWINYKATLSYGLHSLNAKSYKYFFLEHFQKWFNQNYQNK